MKPIRFESQQPVKKKKVKKIFRKLLPIVLIIAILLGVAIFISAKSSSDSVVNYLFPTTNLKVSNGLVNVLLLGTPGGRHDGPSLTDTMMVASYNLKTNKLYLISIPRDLWLPAFKAKANTVYLRGLKQGNGLEFAQTVIGNIVGLPIKYALRVDFNGFVKVIDALGGIDVEVSRTFDDYRYPITGKEDDLCGFEEKEIDFSQEEAIKLNIEPGKRKVFISPDGR